MLDSVIAYVQSADPMAIYSLLFAIAFLKNFFPVVPFDAPIALTGYLLAYKKLSIVLAILWPSLGSTLGFMVIYLISAQSSCRGRTPYCAGTWLWHTRGTRA